MIADPDSRLDLWERRLKESSRKIKRRAAELVPKGLRTPKGSMVVLDDSGEETAGSGSGPNILTKRAVRTKQDVDRELSRLKVNIADRVNRLSASWASDSVVRTREKFSFVLGVCTLAGTCLLWGLAPTWFPVVYTVQALIYLTWRVYSYKKKHFHYFLFDLCYFVNVLDMIWLWFFPSSTVLFICSYCLTMGPLASAIITWRNSLVFHSIDKVTSLFIHIYPPLVFGIILFRYPNAGERYPGIVNVDDYGWIQRIALSAVPYCLWQLTYWKFISVDRHEKIASGQRENSFHYLLHDKHNPIGRALRGIRETHRETWFMFGQLSEFSQISSTDTSLLDYLHDPRLHALPAQRDSHLHLPYRALRCEHVERRIVLRRSVRAQVCTRAREAPEGDGCHECHRVQLIWPHAQQPFYASSRREHARRGPPRRACKLSPHPPLHQHPGPVGACAAGQAEVRVAVPGAHF
jgi:hypothetical protein